MKKALIGMIVLAVWAVSSGPGKMNRAARAQPSQGPGYTITFLGEEVNIGLGRGCPAETDPSVVTFEDGRIVVANTIYPNAAVGINWTNQWGDLWWHYTITPPAKNGSRAVFVSEVSLARRGDDVYLLFGALYSGTIGNSLFLYHSQNRGVSFSLVAKIFDADYSTFTSVAMPVLFFGANGTFYISFTASYKDAAEKSHRSLLYLRSEDGVNFLQTRFDQIEQYMTSPRFIQTTAGQVHLLFFVADAGFQNYMLFDSVSNDDGLSFARPQKIAEYKGLLWYLQNNGDTIGMVAGRLAGVYDPYTDTIYIAYSVKADDGIAEIWGIQKEKDQPWLDPVRLVQDADGVQRNNFLPSLAVGSGSAMLAFLKEEARFKYRAYVAPWPVSGKLASSFPLAGIAVGFTSKLKCSNILINAPFGWYTAMVSLREGFLVVWPDFRNGATDLYARVFSLL